MADEIKKIVKVEVGDSQTSIKSLKQEISDLRDTILNLDKDSKEYADAVNKLQKNQERLNEVMKLSKKATNQEDDALKNLRAQIKQYRNDVLNAEEGTEEWTIAMQNLSNASFQLRDMNEQARYSVDDLGEQLSNINTIATGLAGGFNAVQGAVALFGGESENLEKIMVRLQAGIAVVQGLQGLEGMKDAITGVSNVFNSKLIPTIKNVTKLIGKTGWLAVILAVVSAITIVISKIKEWKEKNDEHNQSLARTNQLLDEKEKRLTKEDRQFEREINLLKARGLTEDEEYTKRLARNKQLEKTEMAILKNLIKSRDKYAEGSANWKDWNEQVVRQQKVLEDLYEEWLDLKYAQDAARESAKRLKKDTETSSTNTSSRKQNTKYTPEYEPNIKNEDDIEPVNDEFDFSTQSNGATARYDAAVYAKELELRKGYAEAILLNGKERYDKEIELLQTFQQEKLDLLNQAIQEENDLQLVGSLMLERAELEIQIEETKNEKLKRLRQENIDNIISTTSASVQAVSSIFNSLADIYESGDKENEKNAKKAKNLRIASATIETLWGSVMAFMSAIQGFPSPANFIIAPLMAAATLASGIATIAKIKSSNPINGGGGASVSSPSVTPAQTFSTAMPMTADNQATNLSNIDEMNTDTRVYILQSDLEDSRKQVEVRESETTF